MFFFVWLGGLFKIVCWKLGSKVDGTAPSLKTAYDIYGWTGRR